MCSDPSLPTYENGNPVGLQVKLSELCIAISNHHTFQNANSLWPTNIDFTSLHQRIVDLNKNGEIWAIIANNIVLQETVAWRTFVSKIDKSGSTLLTWSNMPALRKFDILGGDFAG